MKIGDLAAATDTSVESIRYYANNLSTGLPAGTLGSAVRTNGIAGNQHIALPRRLKPA